MKSLKDILAILVGIAAAIGAIFYFYKFVTDPNPAGGHTSGWIALGLGRSRLCLWSDILPRPRKQRGRDSHYAIAALATLPTAGRNWLLPL